MKEMALSKKQTSLRTFGRKYRIFLDKVLSSQYRKFLDGMYWELTSNILKRGEENEKYLCHCSLGGVG